LSPAKSKAIAVLAIDDNASCLELMRAALQSEDIEMHCASSGSEGWNYFLSKRPQAVLLDLGLPDANGMELLEKMVKKDPGADVILMSGDYSPESAVEAIRKGACDYLDKPFDVERLRLRIRSIIADRQRRQRASFLEHELVDTFTFEGIVGRSPLMLEVFDRMRRVAPHFQTALVTGPTGTGKELVAKALHRLSPRAAKAFVVCNCSAIPETLMESELFGHVRGAFTGAEQDKAGLFEFAGQGTVFLDEIGELPLSAQAKLLRVLQQREVQPVGSAATVAVNVAVVAATNRNLREMVEQKLFREDLFYRLTMVEIKLPGLSHRKEDLVFLQRHFLEQTSANLNRNIRGFTPRAQQVLGRYHWPGNVRELENVIASACMMSNDETVDIDDLPEYVRKAQHTAGAGEAMISLDELQDRHIRRVLEKVGGNKARAAEILGISRSKLYDALSKINEKNAARPS
jgi:DNA-binding NtrC family response regulator